MWRFVQVSDLHLASQRDGQWNNRFLCSMMPELMPCLRSDLQALSPDFVLVTGDIASQPDRDAVFEAKDAVEALGIPYYPMGGNHDFVVENSELYFVAAYQERLPHDLPYYSFTHKGVHFVVLCAWWLWSDDTLMPFRQSEFPDGIDPDTSLEGSRWAIPPHVMHWLGVDLNAHGDLPTIVTCHYPALPIPWRLRRPDIEDAGCLDNGELLCELLSGHPQVKMYLAGHVHMHFIEERAGIVHIATGAMPEYPCEFREFQVYDTHIKVITHALSDPSFAQRSLIPGKDWTAGDDSDRTVTVALVIRD